MAGHSRERQLYLLPYSMMKVGKRLSEIASDLKSLLYQYLFSQRKLSPNRAVGSSWSEHLILGRGGFDLVALFLTPSNPSGGVKKHGATYERSSGISNAVENYGSAEYCETNKGNSCCWGIALGFGGSSTLCSIQDGVYTNVSSLGLQRKASKHEPITTSHTSRLETANIRN